MSDSRRKILASRLIRLGFTQATLAAEVGASRSFVGKLLRGERRSARLEPLLCEQLRLRRKRLYPARFRDENGQRMLTLFPGKRSREIAVRFDHDGTLEPFPLCNVEKS